jgi:hypothetical protein
MRTKSDIFEKTYRDYIDQIGRIDLAAVAPTLGARMKANEIVIPVFGRPHVISTNGITDPSGRKPPLDVCVILSKYILMCPKVPPKSTDWVSYRDFKDAGPLTVYFAHDVEQKIVAAFKGKIEALRKAAQSINATPAKIDAVYDFSMQFAALPKVPLMLLFNDAEENFGAQCSVLFHRNSDQYLDGECLAMLGRLLSTALEQNAMR